MSKLFQKKEKLNQKKENIVSLLEKMKEDFPDNKDEIQGLIDKSENSFLDESYYLDIRNLARSISLKSENETMKIQKIASEYCSESLNILYDEDFLAMKKAIEYDIKFEIYEGMYHFKLPKLTVKSDFKRSIVDGFMDKYIQNHVWNLLLDYEKNNKKLEMFEDFTIIFIHHFTSETEDLYDTDNISIKKPIDSIDNFLIKNDTVKRSHIFQITVLDTEEYTDMYIMKGHILGDATMKLLNLC